MSSTSKENRSWGKQSAEQAGGSGGGESRVGLGKHRLHHWSYWSPECEGMSWATGSCLMGYGAEPGIYSVTKGKPLKHHNHEEQHDEICILE